MATVGTTIAQPLDEPRSWRINQAKPTERQGVEGRAGVGYWLRLILKPSGDLPPPGRTTVIEEVRHLTLYPFQ